MYFYFDLKLISIFYAHIQSLLYKKKRLKSASNKTLSFANSQFKQLQPLTSFESMMLSHTCAYKNTWYMTWLLFWKTVSAKKLRCVAPSSSSTSFSTLSDILHLNAPSLSDKGYNRFLHLNWEKLTFRLQRKLQLNATEPLCLRMKK